MGVHIGIGVPQEYPPYCIALLEALFADYTKATVTKHFTVGQSGAFVFLVEPTRQGDQKELPVVVKIGPNHLLEQERRAAQAHIENRLPGFVPISGELASTVITAEDGSTAVYSAACYQLAGHGVFAIETLRDYALTKSKDALWTVLEERLFQQLDQIWRTSDPPVQRRLAASYDRVLPVNLLLEFAETSPQPHLQIDALGDPARYPQLQPGDWVELKDFIITEIDAAERSLTLNLPPPEGLRIDAYRLRIRNIAHLEQRHLHETVASLTGRVVKTRQLLLHEAIRAALPAAVDLTQPLLHLPDTDQRLPNPLLNWAALLQEQLAMRIGTVHGDLNAGNVLIDIDAKTTFLIDCAHAHRDHVLYDLVRLESEVLLHMVATHFYNHQPQLPPTTIHDLYNWLDFVTRRDPDVMGFYSVPQPLLETMPELQTAFIVLTTIRNHARQYLAVRGQWREYYVALTLTLLGSLKFSSLDDATPGREPKAVAFWGAATLLARLEEPAQLPHIGWRRVAVDEAADAQQQTSGSAQPQVYILFQLPFNGVKAWASDFFGLDEADDHARSSWAGMTLYLLGAVMKRVSGENFLSFLLAAFTAAFAIWSITPILAWPQPDAQERLYAALRFGVAALFLPVLIALLIKPDGEEKFPLHEAGAQWRLLVLKLAGAWTGFGALAGTALIAVILWYHLFGGSMPVIGQWLLALLPPFFAYVSARRIPSDRYKMFGGELRLHAADRLFFAVFALFGPGLAAVVYWGHWFLINQGVMLSVLLGSIGLIVWEIHRHNKRRFPDLLVIAILGLLLPLGFLLLFFFDMYPLAPAPTPGAGEAGIFAALATYVLGTTLLLATVAVRQQTILTIRSVLGLSALLVFVLVLLRVNLWFGGAIGIGLLLLWYLWGRSRVTRWHQVHPSVDLLGLVIIGAALLGVLTPVPLWGNAMLFALFAGVLVLWAYQKNDPGTPDQMGQRPAQNSSLKRWGILLFIIVAIAGLAVVVANTLIGDSLSTTPAQDAANTPTALATGTANVQPAALAITPATATPTATPTATTTPARLTVARSAPGANRYFIAGPSLADYQLGQLLAVYAQASAGQEFDVAVVLVVDKNIDNLVVQVIFQNENYPLDSLAALQLDDQIDDVDLASMAPVNDSYVGFMLADATIRLASAAPVKVGDQLEAVQLTRSGDTLRFPAGPIMIHIDSIGTDRKIAGVSAPTSLPSLGTLLVLAPESATSTSTPAPSPTSIATPTAANTPAPQPQSDVPIYESFDGVIKLDWKNARGEWGSAISACKCDVLRAGWLPY